MKHLYSCVMLRLISTGVTLTSVVLLSQPENVIVDLSCSSSVLKLIDLGDAVNTTRNLEVLPPSNLEFAAPEMVLGQPVGCQTDMWSVGVFLYAFLR